MKKSFSLKRNWQIALLVLVGVFVVATGFERRGHHPLKSVASEILPNFAMNEQRILVDAQAMTPEESKRNFGHDLLDRGVRPLHLTIQNNTSNEYSICPSSVDMPGVEASKIAERITRLTIPRSIGYKLLGLFFWPLMIPGTIDSIRVIKHYEDIKKDVTAKSVRDEVIAPYSTFHRVFFVSKGEFKESFKITLIDLESLEPKEFQIALSQETT